MRQGACNSTQQLQYFRLVLNLIKYHQATPMSPEKCTGIAQCGLVSQVV